MNDYFWTGLVLAALWVGLWLYGRWRVSHDRDGVEP